MVKVIPAEGATAVSQPPAVEMTVVTDPVEIAKTRELWKWYDRNWEWYQKHIVEIGEKYRGKYICIAAQELFVGDSVPEVTARARAAHPEDPGHFTSYIPKARGYRIYANFRCVEPWQ